MRVFEKKSTFTERCTHVPCFITSLVFSVLLLSKTVEGGFVSPSETALFDASEESTELLEELNLALSMAEVELEVEVPPPPAAPAAPDEGTGFELRSPPGSSSSARCSWNCKCDNLGGLQSGAKLHAVLPDFKNFQTRILKKY